MANIALLTAAGASSRMHQDIPKQFLTINDRPVIIYTLEAFEKHPEIDAIAVVCLSGWEQVLMAYARQFNITKLRYVIPGGVSNQDSIRKGIYELEQHFSGDDIVLIHDGNRPMVSAEIISDCIRVARQYGNAIPAIPCAEAILQTDDGMMSSCAYPREQLRRTQTPHAFPLARICDLHRRAQKAGIQDTAASCALMIELGERVFFSVGSEKNIKLTTLDDIDIFKALLAAKRADWLKE